MGLDKIAILFRESQKLNRFRKVISGTFQINIDEMIICSGYFQEKYETSKFEASNAFKSPKCKQLILVSTKDAQEDQKKSIKEWDNSFIRFCKSMEQKMGNNMTLYKARTNTWHAKIMIGKIKQNDSNDLMPGIAMIGSSNLTRPAFGISSPYNYECDVVFWDTQIKAIDDLMSSILNQDGDDGVIVSNYDINDPYNRNKSLESRVKELENQIFDQNIVQKISLDDLIDNKNTLKNKQNGNNKPQ